MTTSYHRISIFKVLIASVLLYECNANCDLSGCTKQQIANAYIKLVEGEGTCGGDTNGRHTNNQNCKTSGCSATILENSFGTCNVNPTCAVTLSGHVDLCSLSGYSEKENLDFIECTADPCTVADCCRAACSSVSDGSICSGENYYDVNKEGFFCESAPCTQANDEDICCKHPLECTTTDDCEGDKVCKPDGTKLKCQDPTPQQCVDASFTCGEGLIVDETKQCAGVLCLASEFASENSACCKSACPANCAVCVDETECSECASDYFLKDGACVQDCGVGYTELISNADASDTSDDTPYVRVFDNYCEFYGYTSIYDPVECETASTTLPFNDGTLGTWGGASDSHSVNFCHQVYNKYANPPIVQSNTLGTFNTNMGIGDNCNQDGGLHCLCKKLSFTGGYEITHRATGFPGDWSSGGNAPTTSFNDGSDKTTSENGAVIKNCGEFCLGNNIEQFIVRFDGNQCFCMPLPLKEKNICSETTVEEVEHLSISYGVPLCSAAPDNGWDYHNVADGSDASGNFMSFQLGIPPPPPEPQYSGPDSCLKLQACSDATDHVCTGNTVVDTTSFCAGEVCEADEFGDQSTVCCMSKQPCMVASQTCAAGFKTDITQFCANSYCEASDFGDASTSCCILDCPENCDACTDADRCEECAAGYHVKANGECEENIACSTQLNGFPNFCTSQSLLNKADLSSITCASIPCTQDECCDVRQPCADDVSGGTCSATTTKDVDALCAGTVCDASDFGDASTSCCTSKQPCVAAPQLHANCAEGTDVDTFQFCATDVCQPDDFGDENTNCCKKTCSGNCAQCTDTDTCTYCNENYFLKEGQCLQDCGSDHLIVPLMASPTLQVIQVVPLVTESRCDITCSRALLDPLEQNECTFALAQTYDFVNGKPPEKYWLGLSDGFAYDHTNLRLGCFKIDYHGQMVWNGVAGSKSTQMEDEYCLCKPRPLDIVQIQVVDATNGPATCTEVCDADSTAGLTALTEEECTLSFAKSSEYVNEPALSEGVDSYWGDTSLTKTSAEYSTLAYNDRPNGCIWIDYMNQMRWNAGQGVSTKSGDQTTYCQCKVTPNTTPRCEPRQKCSEDTTGISCLGTSVKDDEAYCTGQKCDGRDFGGEVFRPTEPFPTACCGAPEACIASAFQCNAGHKKNSNQLCDSVRCSDSDFGDDTTTCCVKDCPDNCDDCSDSETCTQCAANYHVKEDGKCTSNCYANTPGYFLGTDNVCKTCGEHCLECGERLVEIDYGFSQVVACPGTAVQVNWQGYHNIQETEEAACDSTKIGDPVVDFRSIGFDKFYGDELTASPGTTRYFKCDAHCSLTESRFEVTCPTESIPHSVCTTCAQGYHSKDGVCTPDISCADELAGDSTFCTGASLFDKENLAGITCSSSPCTVLECCNAPEACAEDTDFSCDVGKAVVPDAVCANVECVENDFTSGSCCGDRKNCEDETVLTCDADLIVDTNTCAGVQCLASEFGDVSTTCCAEAPVAQCASISADAEFCSSDGSRVYDSSKALVECVAFPCSPEADVDTCCVVAMKCEAMETGTYGHLCPDANKVFDPSKRSEYCAGPECAEQDVAKCCMDLTTCSSLADDASSTCTDGWTYNQAAWASSCLAVQCGTDDRETCCTAPICNSLVDDSSAVCTDGYIYDSAREYTPCSNKVCDADDRGNCCRSPYCSEAFVLNPSLCTDASMLNVNSPSTMLCASGVCTISECCVARELCSANNAHTCPEGMSTIPNTLCDGVECTAEEFVKDVCCDDRENCKDETEFACAAPLVVDDKECAGVACISSEFGGAESTCCTPAAMCSTIANDDTFCKNEIANGFVDCSGCFDSFIAGGGDSTATDGGDWHEHFKQGDGHVYGDGPICMYDAHADGGPKVYWSNREAVGEPLFGNELNSYTILTGDHCAFAPSYEYDGSKIYNADNSNEYCADKTCDIVDIGTCCKNARKCSDIADSSSQWGSICDDAGKYYDASKADNYCAGSDCGEDDVHTCCTDIVTCGSLEDDASVTCTDHWTYNPSASLQPCTDNECDADDRATCCSPPTCSLLSEDVAIEFQVCGSDQIYDPEKYAQFCSSEVCDGDDAQLCCKPVETCGTVPGGWDTFCLNADIRLTPRLENAYTECSDGVCNNDLYTVPVDDNVARLNTDVGLCCGITCATGASGTECSDYGSDPNVDSTLFSDSDSFNYMCDYDPLKCDGEDDLSEDAYKCCAPPSDCWGFVGVYECPDGYHVDTNRNCAGIYCAQSDSATCCVPNAKCSIGSMQNDCSFCQNNYIMSTGVTPNWQYDGNILEKGPGLEATPFGCYILTDIFGDRFFIYSNGESDPHYDSSKGNVLTIPQIPSYEDLTQYCVNQFVESSDPQFDGTNCPDGTFKTADSTKTCEGATCQASDASRCCETEAPPPCNPWFLNGFSCPGNQVITEDDSKICAELTCAESDSAVCCEDPKQSCDQYETADRVCEGGDAAVLLTSNFCAGSVCATSDAETCCGLKATCSTISSDSFFCPYNKMYDTRKNSVNCAGTTCISNVDGDTCCMLPPVRIATGNFGYYEVCPGDIVELDLTNADYTPSFIVQSIYNSCSEKDQVGGDTSAFGVLMQDSIQVWDSATHTIPDLQKCVIHLNAQECYDYAIIHSYKLGDGKALADGKQEIDAMRWENSWLYSEGILVKDPGCYYIDVVKTNDARLGENGDGIVRNVVLWVDEKYIDPVEIFNHYQDFETETDNNVLICNEALNMQYGVPNFKNADNSLSYVICPCVQWRALGIEQNNGIITYYDDELAHPSDISQTHSTQIYYDSNGYSSDFCFQEFTTTCLRQKCSDAYVHDNKRCSSGHVLDPTKADELCPGRWCEDSDFGDDSSFCCTSTGNHCGEWEPTISINTQSTSVTSEALDTAGFSVGTVHAHIATDSCYYQSGGYGSPLTNTYHPSYFRVHSHVTDADNNVKVKIEQCGCAEFSSVDATCDYATVKEELFSLADLQTKVAHGNMALCAGCGADVQYKGYKTPDDFASCNEMHTTKAQCANNEFRDAGYSIGSIHAHVVEDSCYYQSGGYGSPSTYTYHPSYFRVHSYGIDSDGVMKVKIEQCGCAEYSSPDEACAYASVKEDLFTLADLQTKVANGNAALCAGCGTATQYKDYKTPDDFATCDEMHATKSQCQPQSDSNSNTNIITDTVSVTALCENTVVEVPVMNAVYETYDGPGTCADAGKMIITTSEECNAAAIATGASVQAINNWISTYPSGCYFDPNGASGSGVYLNTNFGTGVGCNWAHGRYCICKTLVDSGTTTTESMWFNPDNEDKLCTDGMLGNECTIEECCNQPTQAAKCSSIASDSSFCASYDSASIYDTSKASTECDGPYCVPEKDGSKCCAQGPTCGLQFTHPAMTDDYGQTVDYSVNRFCSSGANSGSDDYKWVVDNYDNVACTPMYDDSTRCLYGGDNYEKCCKQRCSDASDDMLNCGAYRPFHYFNENDQETLETWCAAYPCTQDDAAACCKSAPPCSYFHDYDFDSYCSGRYKINADQYYNARVDPNHPDGAVEICCGDRIPHQTCSAAQADGICDESTHVKNTDELDLECYDALCVVSECCTSKQTCGDAFDNDPDGYLADEKELQICGPAHVRDPDSAELLCSTAKCTRNEDKDLCCIEKAKCADYFADAECSSAGPDYFYGTKEHMRHGQTKGHPSQYSANAANADKYCSENECNVDDTHDVTLCCTFTEKYCDDSVTGFTDEICSTDADGNGRYGGLSPTASSTACFDGICDLDHTSSFERCCRKKTCGDAYGTAAQCNSKLQSQLGGLWEPLLAQTDNLCGDALGGNKDCDHVNNARMCCYNAAVHTCASYFPTREECKAAGHDQEPDYKTTTPGRTCRYSDCTTDESAEKCCVGSGRRLSKKTRVRRL